MWVRGGVGEGKGWVRKGMCRVGVGWRGVGRGSGVGGEGRVGWMGWWEGWGRESGRR